MKGRSHKTLAGAVLLWLLAVAVKALLVMILWNLLLPHLFSVPGLHYMEAIGLMLLADLVFGRWNQRWFHRHTLKRHLRSQYESMTPDERRCLRQLFMKVHRCRCEDAQKEGGDNEGIAVE